MLLSLKPAEILELHPARGNVLRARSDQVNSLRKCASGKLKLNETKNFTVQLTRLLTRSGSIAMKYLASRSLPELSPLESPYLKERNSVQTIVASSAVSCVPSSTKT